MQDTDDGSNGKKYSLSNQWKFLLNETLVGERYIVRELARLTRKTLPTFLRYELLAQLDDEVRHVKLYANFGVSGASGSGYEKSLESRLSPLPLRCKLFAFRVLLEGAALGMLRLRPFHWPANPSSDVDATVLADELRHVLFSEESREFMFSNGYNEDVYADLQLQLAPVMASHFSFKRLSEVNNSPFSADDRNAKRHAHDLRAFASQGISESVSQFLREKHGSI